MERKRRSRSRSQTIKKDGKESSSSSSSFLLSEKKVSSLEDNQSLTFKAEKPTTNMAAWRQKEEEFQLNQTIIRAGLRID